MLRMPIFRFSIGTLPRDTGSLIAIAVAAVVTTVMVRSANETAQLLWVLPAAAGAVLFVSVLWRNIRLARESTKCAIACFMAIAAGGVLDWLANVAVIVPNTPAETVRSVVIYLISPAIFFIALLLGLASAMLKRRGQ